MPAIERLSFITERGAWESSTYLDAAGAHREWQAAVVLSGGSDGLELIQAASDGYVYYADTGETDYNTAIAYDWTSKKYDMGGMLAMVHSVYLRADATNDDLTLTVTAGGSEYGTVAQTYDVSFAGTGEVEVRVRVHREIMGRWLQLRMTGSVSERPAVREVIARVIPIRSQRVSA